METLPPGVLRRQSSSTVWSFSPSYLACQTEDCRDKNPESNRRDAIFVLDSLPSPSLTLRDYSKVGVGYKQPF
jgi:hypothetical protein